MTEQNTRATPGGALPPEQILAGAQPAVVDGAQIGNVVVQPSNPFAGMSLEEAQNGGLWALVDVTVTETAKTRDVQIAINRVAVDMKVSREVLADNAAVPFGALIRERLELDFQELAVVVGLKVDATPVTVAEEP